jgi:hypothetical protein
MSELTTRQWDLLARVSARHRELEAAQARVDRLSVQRSQAVRRALASEVPVPLVATQLDVTIGQVHRIKTLHQP